MKNQSGYIGIILIILLTIVGFAIYPIDFNLNKSQEINLKPSVSSGILYTSTGCQKPTGTLPEFDSNSYSVDTRGEEDSDWVTFKNDDQVTFQQVLKDVPILTDFLNSDLNGGRFDNKGIVTDFSANKLVTIEAKQYYLLYPRGHGTVGISKGYGGRDVDFRPALNGMVFLAHTDENLDPITIDGYSIGYDKKGNFLITDVYQVQSLVASNPIPEIIIAECQGLNKDTSKKGVKKDKGNQNTLPSTQEVDPKVEAFLPDQQKSEDKRQLQLEYFYFNSQTSKFAGDTGAWYTHCKPAIYLYPQEVTKINVKVNTKGYLTYTDPVYPEGLGWDVLAYPNGKLIYHSMNNELRTLNYLYYESKVPDELISIPSEGYVVSFDQFVSLHQTLLPALGLNKTQITEYIEYWTKALPYSEYYFVGIMPQENIDQIEPLEITPKPDLNIRVRLYYKVLDHKPDQLPKLPNLSKLTPNNYQLAPNLKMVEWGGMVKLDKSHPFTCSQ